MPSAPPQLDNAQYTVGWIAALPHERAAAEAMLDKEHAPPQHKQENDHNIYTLGSINGSNGEHHVVIASLPPGRYGTTPAATAAIQMLSSFPAIKFGLMVGIGGGISSIDNDIRLGDVVVSQPNGTFGGVRQYDCGKATADGFDERGALNSPPRVLLNALGALQSKHERRGSTMPGILQLMYKNFPLMAKPRIGPGYVYQGAGNDRLFQSNYDHQSNEKNCSACDKAKQVVRSERSDQDPYIHYGTIASGNAVIKDARRRDLMQGDCLCFETEAAGLMNDFPCLVIRGICDYCDSHKNDQWQKYAAATAAAYAKELLQTTDLADVKSTPEARKVMHQLQKVLEKVTHVQQQVKEGFGSFREGQKEHERHEILNWLTRVDYGPQYSDILTRRYEGTGRWLLDSTEYQTWLKTKGQTLFCPGIPGAGKTVLSAIVIHDLYTRFGHDPSIGIVYLFCNFQRHHEQTLEHLLLSMLKQLSQQQNSIPNSVKKLYGLHKNRTTRPSISEITTLLQSVAANFSTVIVLVDALDECQTTDGCRRDFISEILTLQDKVGASIFGTSRHIDEITRMFDGCISLDIRATDKDVKMYLKGQMRRFKQDIMNDAIQATIESEVIGTANGMFLLAALHMNRLVDLPTRGDIKIVLQNIARRGDNIDAAYRKTMEKIECQDKHSQSLAKRTIAWIIHARRQLSAEELRYALAVRAGTKGLDEDDIPSASVLLSVCAGLVTIDEKQGIIRLVHHTTLEFFMHTKQDWPQDMQADMAETCLTYLLFDCFQAGSCQTDKDFKARLKTDVFYGYAARNWGHHMLTSSNEELNLLALGFLDNETTISAYSQVMMGDRQDILSSHRIAKQTTGLHLATYFGLERCITAILGKGADVNSKDSEGQTPLRQAAGLGHEVVVKLLLENGADPDIEDDHGIDANIAALMNGYGYLLGVISQERDRDKSVTKWMLISAAVARGHEAVAKLLLENGLELEADKNALCVAAVMGRETDMKLLLGKCVNPEVEDSDGQTPLHLAAGMGHEAVVNLLLRKGVDPEAKDDDGETPLHLAAMSGHEAVVKLLLGKGVESEVEDSDGQTPLHLAAQKGYEAVVKLLLGKGVNLEANDSNGKTPLHLASQKGHEAVAKLLLETGVEPEVKANKGYTPLHLAAQMGQETVVKLLLETGVEPEVKANKGYTPLHWASQKGHEAVVKLLLEKGVEPEVKAKNGYTPLHWAAQKGHGAVAKLLLEKGVDPEAKDNNGETSLHLAAQKGQETVVKLLLETGVEPEVKANKGYTPLHWAAQKGHGAVAKLLLEKGVDPETKDYDGETPLHMAAMTGHEAVVKLLLGKVVDLEVEDGDGQTPLHLAAQMGHEAVVNLLLEKGVNPEVEDSDGETPLHSAAQMGKEAVVKLLLEKGVNPEVKANNGYTPLHWAAQKGHGAVAKLLLEKGVDPEAKDDNRETPLHMAAMLGHEAVVKLLLGKGVDPEAENNDGYMPLHLAAWMGHEAVVNLLLEKGVDSEAKENDGCMPLRL